jgi:hypothetical protein
MMQYYDSDYHFKNQTFLNFSYWERKERSNERRKEGGKKEGRKGKRKGRRETKILVSFL